jgi:hypothetical protein
VKEQNAVPKAEDADPPRIAERFMIPARGTRRGIKSNEPRRLAFKVPFF